MAQQLAADDLRAFIRARIAAAERDKAIYERNGARLNGQLLQGEINLGTAILAWLDRQAAPAAATDADDEADAAETPERD